VTAGSVEGVAAHSGATVRVHLHRCEGGIVFRREGETIPADVAFVVATPRCTVLGHGALTVAMVEHLLAALRVAGFWSGVLVAVDGPELPILDGSAAPWAPAVASLGSPPPAPEPLRLERSLRFSHGRSTIEARPGPEGLEVEIAFDHPAIGAQAWAGPAERYAELLAARTFVLEADLEALRARGLARGAAPGRGILFDVHGPTEPLRSPDEPVRHKALDAVGDFSLLGRPLAATVRIDHGSHEAHVRFMRQLRHCCTATTDPASARRPRQE
jgi:UDP-3-O-[3-hydroxymyristoyl] N-acetylglucosamine deacetylase